MKNTITSTDFNFLGQRSVYKGKVRDVYNINDDVLVMVVTDRLSAFDVILPKGIPYKGQVLNSIAIKFMEQTENIVPNWIIHSPDPNVIVGHLCDPFKIEMVIRGYLSGHAWRVYKSGIRKLCGVVLPEGLKENEKLPHPIITPTIKADIGQHDQDITKEDIIKNNIVSPKEWDILQEYTYSLFEKGSEIADNKNLILVDTKYEFGKNKDGKILLIDELHTADSARYFYKDEYDITQSKGGEQRQLSKEFVRQWLISKGFQGLDKQSIPDMSDDFIQIISQRYIELYEKITGEVFSKEDSNDPLTRIKENVDNFLKTI
ncbi:phosphoribosylaminoimidazolesuccinocarboxamide synthase [Ichthyobacterium seriolicida]|uniref:Phosphoribosylaminoimidazole-succinocarboxamide synthase n=1 Tax=Ichthyobacterium seriolicida TaxID=242600 RepID=A0A1J1E4Q7_9FLAO|nr:phosphoribosylaminoimidazolesuccinocarboxamide synthase [Ichthyobacterium seriolicida]BAV94302.1 phosphoribosylaminoimidazole-succinocarboxamide synthase [Ichthyobacterium seriolicida]